MYLIGGKYPPMGHFLGGLSDQGIIPDTLGQFLIFIISKCVSVIILTYMHVTFRGVNTLSWGIF